MGNQILEEEDRMKPPQKDFYEDDPEGWDAAWQGYEEACEDLRDRRRDEQTDEELKTWVQHNY